MSAGTIARSCGEFQVDPVLLKSPRQVEDADIREPEFLERTKSRTDVGTFRHRTTTTIQNDVRSVGQMSDGRCEPFASLGLGGRTDWKGSGNVAVLIEE